MNQDRMRNEGDRNRASDMEEAQGSRERVRGSSGSSGMGSGSSKSGGISNRERSREECEQDQLPDRGQSNSER